MKNVQLVENRLKGFLGANLIDTNKIEFINKHLNLNNQKYCTSCAKPLLTSIYDQFVKQKAEIEIRLKQIIHKIPILTGSTPSNWKYEAIDIITTQTTSGTGFATELSRSFNDFFGSTSNTTNLKIEKAVNLCKMELRIQCVRKGGNALVDCDIDFNEIGTGSTNMLMICMSGTAIKVTDMTNFRESVRKDISEIVDLIEKLELINQETK